MRTRHILFLLAFAPMLFSCTKDPYEVQNGSGDGTPTRVTLSIKADTHTKSDRHDDPVRNLLAGALSLPGTRSLTPAQESLIANVHVLVFDDNGVIHTNKHFSGMNISSAENISLETPSGKGRQIWVVANGDVNDDTDAGHNLDNDLKAVTTIDELKSILVRVKGNGLDRTERLTMVGTTTIDIAKPHNTAIPVELHFLAAKATVTIKDNTPAEQGITIIGWDMVNIPVKTYLTERTGDDQADAVNPAQSSDYLSTNGKYIFATVDAANKTWRQSVYLFENRRGGRVDRSDPTNPADKYPGMSVGDNNQRGKAWYAPPGATYMLIYGTYTKDGQMNNIVYKIYLGDNPVDDYNITRGKYYEYNVTINGLNDINIDTNVEWGSASFSVDKSDNLMMDAHPDFRVLRIGGTAVDDTTPAYATVEVLEADGTTPCTWLSVSPLNLYRHGIKQSAGANQQFGAGDGTGSYVRAKYTPAPTAESEFADATFSMTRKLTKIPFTQPAVYTYQNVIIYADAYDGTADRAAKVRITYYKGADGTEAAGQRTYDITQSGSIKVSDDLYIERYEESAMLMHPNLPAGLQNTTTMQWGYNTAALYGAADRYTNGAYLTANAVYNNVTARNGMDAPAWTANAYADYRAKYPRTGAQVTEPTSLPADDPTYFYPTLSATTPISDYFHPIFNSSAARYCHEKNRDTDGDGVISAAETFWYLPSMADLVEIAAKKPVELNLTGTYWTSSEEGADKSWAFTFPAGSGAAAAKTTAYRVRCVRGNGVATLPEANFESTESDKTKINLASIAGAAGAFVITDAMGLPWTVTSSDASWLKVATAANGTGAASPATGAGTKTLYAYALSGNTNVTDARTATLTLARAGMSDKTITIIQEKYVPPASTISPSAVTMPCMMGQSVAFTIDNKGTGLQWTVTSNQSWLTVAPDATGIGSAASKTGTTNATLFAYAESLNTAASARSATITLSRSGMANITLTVTQQAYAVQPTAGHAGWAGSNIYWDPNYTNADGSMGRLTFDDTGANTPHAQWHGVIFKWGSLVAIGPNSGTVIFSPTGLPASTPFADVPFYLAQTEFPRHALGENCLISKHNPKANVGDICKYITDRGWAPAGKRWRMPTYNELVSLLSTVWAPATNGTGPTTPGDNYGGPGPSATSYKLYTTAYGETSLTSLSYLGYLGKGALGSSAKGTIYFVLSCSSSCQWYKNGTPATPATYANIYGQKIFYGGTEQSNLGAGWNLPTSYTASFFANRKDYSQSVRCVSY